MITTCYRQHMILFNTLYIITSLTFGFVLLLESIFTAHTSNSTNHFVCGFQKFSFQNTSEKKELKEDNKIKKH